MIQQVSTFPFGIKKTSWKVSKRSKKFLHYFNWMHSNYRQHSIFRIFENFVSTKNTSKIIYSLFGLNGQEIFEHPIIFKRGWTQWKQYKTLTTAA